MITFLIPFWRIPPPLWQAQAEIQEDAVAPGQKIVLIDDLLATGGEGAPAWRVSVTIHQKEHLIGSHIAVSFLHLNLGHSSWLCACCVAGTLSAACELMKKQQAEILGCLVVIELKDLKGLDKVKPHSVFSLVQY